MNSLVFPRRLSLKKPSSADLSERFDDVRRWIAELQKCRHYRLIMRELRHKIIGTNLVPDEIWVDTIDDALRLIRKQQESAVLIEIIHLIDNRMPALLPWLAKRPLLAIEISDDVPMLLDVVEWIQAHPKPGIYLRQIDIPGVHTKFIETHRAVLTEMLDHVTSSDEINTEAKGMEGFCRRYGFLEKPLRIRFRILDPDFAVIRNGSDQDITLNQEAFNRLDLGIRQIVITENEINFLAFPALKEGMVIFGSGYGFEMLAGAEWMKDCAIHYWGDIDTHGFAILDQLRACFPEVKSFLMDRETLVAHRALWLKEPKPTLRDLQRLSPEERMLFDELRYNRLGSSVRLEQERIGFPLLTDAVRCLRRATQQETGQRTENESN